jgi:hypothetical protein
MLIGTLLHLIVFAAYKITFLFLMNDKIVPTQVHLQWTFFLRSQSSLSPLWC